LARICTAALPGKYTVPEIATAAGLREDQAPAACGTGGAGRVA